jgi:hypothetical protein
MAVIAAQLGHADTRMTPLLFLLLLLEFFLAVGGRLHEATSNAKHPYYATSRIGSWTSSRARFRTWKTSLKN